MPKCTENARFLPMMRAMVRAYQAFERYGCELIRGYGMRPPEFDVLVTLGDTQGMTFTELGRHTLIFKTTLTGVVDKLEGRGLVRREPLPQDRRCMRVSLTQRGQALFEEIFPPHVAAMGERFEQLSAAEMEQTRHLMERIRSVFEVAPQEGAGQAREGAE